MRPLRIARTPLVARTIQPAPVSAIPKIALNIPRSAVVQSPTDEHLVGDVLKSTPRVKRAPRRDGYLHVSDLIGKGKCTRKIALTEKFGVPIKYTRLGIFDRIVFAIGDAIHDTVKKIVTEGGPGLVWGLWKCQCGHLYHTEPCLQSEIDQEDTCPLCGTSCGYYKEVSLFNEEYRIVGNPDLLFYLPELDAFHVIELKSIAELQYKDLVRPLPEHILQVVFYWFLMIKSGRKVTDRVSIVYITKGYQFKGDAHKEFMINPRVEVERLLPYLEDAMRAKLSHSQEIYPARKACSAEMSVQAKQCEVCSLCFSLPA